MEKELDQLIIDDRTKTDQMILSNSSHYDSAGDEIAKDGWSARRQKLDFYKSKGQKTMSTQQTDFENTGKKVLQDKNNEIEYYDPGQQQEYQMINTV